jgi:hypothetical protein
LLNITGSAAVCGRLSEEEKKVKRVEEEGRKIAAAVQTELREAAK